MALPAGAVFEATLEDMTRADATAVVLARTRVESPQAPPIPFTLTYDPTTIDQSHRYTVRARISHADQVLFITDTHHPVLTSGESGPIEIMLRRVALNASLEDTQWSLLTLNGAMVEPSTEQQSPNLTLQSQAKRVVGFSGCNRFTGAYTLDGQKLSFGQIAGTRMACAHGMEIEQALQKMLTAVGQWRVVNQRLELQDADGTPLAQFEAR